jgi:hypothetical protein
LIGIKEIELPDRALLLASRRIRRAAAGRKKLEHRDPGVCAARERLVELAISLVSIGVVLKGLGLKSASQSQGSEGRQSPHRNGQFAYMNDKTDANWGVQWTPRRRSWLAATSSGGTHE